MRSASTAAALLVLALSARAEESLEDVMSRIRTAWQPWQDCEPGSWIQTRTTSRTGTQETRVEQRQTLLKRTEKELVVEVRDVTSRVDGATGLTIQDLGKPTETTISLEASTGTYEEPKELRREDVTVDGKSLSCRVVEATWVYKFPNAVNGQQEIRTKMTLWVSGEVKEMGGIVKTETDSNANANGGMTWSSDMTLVSTGREIKVGNRTLKCRVWKYGNASGNETMVGSGEVWMCADVPFGYVKSVSKHHFANGNTRMVSEYESEITGMEIVRPKEE